MEEEVCRMKISFTVVKRRALFVGLAAALVVASVLLILFKGFNLGIDFESGLSISVRISDNVQIEDVRRSLESVEGVRVQNVGSADDGRYQIRTKLMDGQDQRSMESMIYGRLDSAFSNVEHLESNFIGAKFSSSLITGSVKAVAIALVLILIYVWVRFKVAYSIGAIVALMHDVILMLGFISLVGFEVSSTTIAAILTIIGYSLNNTIVIFDRIRESIRNDNSQDLSAVMDYGVNSSLTRTTYSSITTLLAVLPLAILANGDVRSFAICMIFGVVIGTYSSNFLATNILYTLGKLESFDILKMEVEDDLSDVAMAQRMLDDEKDQKKIVKFRKEKPAKKDGDDPKILV